MTEQQIEEINKEYADYCKHDGNKLYHIPFVIWLKHKKKIKPSDYYREGK